MQTLGAIRIQLYINVLSKGNNIVSNRSSSFEGRHNDHRSSKVVHPSSKVDTSIIDPTHRSSIFESRHIDLRRSTHRSSIFEGRHIDLRRSKADIAPTFRQFVTEGTHADTLIYCNRPTRALVMYYTPIYIALHALVGGAISIRDPYICAVLRICANGSHAVFHRPVV